MLCRHYFCVMIKYISEKLPKTRSGKVLRGTMKNILNKKKYNFPPTIEDENVLTMIHQAVDLKGLKM